MNTHLTPIEYVLIGSLIVSILIAGYLTFMRVIYGIHHITYDSWIFGMNLALLLTIHDSSCMNLVENGKNKK